MPLSTILAGRVKDYFVYLEDRLVEIDRGIRIMYTFTRALDIYVANRVLERALPELVTEQVACYTLWQDDDRLGLKERYDLGTPFCDPTFTKLRGLQAPRINVNKVKGLARLVANRLAGEDVREHVNLNTRQPVQAIVHREKSLGTTSFKVYSGSSIYLRHDWFYFLQDSPIEQHLRQYLDFLHTLRQETKPARNASGTR